jgi:hypothetical protein
VTVDTTIRAPTRLSVIVLLVVCLLLPLSLLLGACGGPSSSDSHADWSSFTTVDGPGLSSSNLDDLSRHAGFRFVLPSYIPPGVSHRFFLSSQVQPTLEGGGVVNLMPDDNAPRDIQIGIQINEQLRPESGPPSTNYGRAPDVERIGGIDVGCRTETPDETSPTPTPNEGYPAGLTCEWETEQLWFLVAFGWPTESGATPEVTPERRAEAIKVVTSMIEDPYIP